MELLAMTGAMFVRRRSSGLEVLMEASPGGGFAVVGAGRVLWDPLIEDGLSSATVFRSLA
jgi:hypothetical protein